MSLRQGEGQLKGGGGGSAQLGDKMNTHTQLITNTLSGFGSPVSSGGLWNSHGLQLSS